MWHNAPVSVNTHVYYSSVMNTCFLFVLPVIFLFHQRYVICPIKTHLMWIYNAKCCRNRLLWSTMTTSQLWVNFVIISPPLNQPPHHKFYSKNSFLWPATFCHQRLFCLAEARSFVAGSTVPGSKPTAAYVLSVTLTVEIHEIMTIASIKHI